jgi:excisionase family DNA binding protein
MDNQTGIQGSDFPRLALSPDEAARSAGVARTRIFKAIADEELQARKSGRATLIEITELARWIGSLPTRGRQQAAA